MKILVEEGSKFKRFKARARGRGNSIVKKNKSCYCWFVFYKWREKMGQKTNPKILRLGIVDNWDSIWYDNYDYKKNNRRFYN